MIELRPWSDDDLWVAERFLSDAAMMEHLGGPQSHDRIRDAHRRYLDTNTSGTGQMFTIALGNSTSEVVGNIGFWDRTWREELVYETGWMVFPEFQGRGLASQALAMLLARLRRERVHPFVHAFPSIANGPSNAICRKAGFTDLGECALEYPPGHPMRCNDWVLDLSLAPESGALSS